MLVLSRKVGESILVGRSVKVTITKAKGNCITLGLEGPADVQFLRGELAPPPQLVEEGIVEGTGIGGQGTEGGVS